MPAFFLLLRIGCFVIPLPWFVLWLMLLPFVPLAIILSPFFSRKHYGKVLQNAHLAWWCLTALHGLRVDVNGRNKENIYFSFV